MSIPVTYTVTQPLREAAASRPPSPYAGLATRVLAFAADAVVINVVAWLTALIVGLCLSLIDLPTGVVSAIAAIGALIGLVWTVGYFVFFWSTDGQTPGDRLLKIRVEEAQTRRPPRPRRALVRALFLPLSALPLCLGFALVLVDDRRRALHDCLAGTVVADVATADDAPRHHAPRG